MKFRKTILLTLAPPLLALGLSMVGAPGHTSAASRFKGSDDKAVKAYCKKAIGKNASQSQIGACYQGYVFGYDGTGQQSKCKDIYKNNSKAIQACRNQGYNGGLHNSANVKSPSKNNGGTQPVGASKPADVCGKDPGIVISINIGCKNQGNPVADMLFAIIRVLSMGVGLVVVGSIVVGGIQYSASRGDPQATAMAINRIRSSLFALLIYIFGFALLNYIIPGAILQ